MRKLPKTLTEEEVLKLFTMVYDPKHKMMIKLMFYCGLRVSEMLRLKRADIDLKEQLLRVISGKGGKDRLIPIPKPLIHDLKRYLNEYFMVDKENLFETTPDNTRKMMQKLSKRFGKKVHPHMLRHSYATYVLEKTNNLELVRDLLGHSDIKITQIYTHMTTQSKKENIDRIWK